MPRTNQNFADLHMESEEFYRSVEESLKRNEELRASRSYKASKSQWIVDNGNSLSNWFLNDPQIINRIS